MKRIYLYILMILCSIMVGFPNHAEGQTMHALQSARLTKTALSCESTQYGTIFAKKTGVRADTAESQNTIRVWENSTGEVLVTLNLKEKNQHIRITVWNMLGKVVINDFDGEYKSLENEHILKGSVSLTRGAYLVRVLGDKCKIDGKFIKTK